MSDIDPRAKLLAQSEPARDNDPANLDPAFRDRLARALDELARAGTPFKLVEGFRTVERQQWLFGSGRPNAEPFGRSGSIVTYRDGVQSLSNHQGTGVAGTGRGADCYPTRNGKVFIPPASDPLWDQYATALERQGLIAGQRWTKLKDSPHAEMQVATGKRSLDFVRSIEVPKAARRRKAPMARRARGAMDAMAVPAGPPTLEDKTAQALVAGSGFIVTDDAVSAQTKEDIVNSNLLAQFWASSKADRTDVLGWYNEYFSALQRLGWLMTSNDFRAYEQEGKSVQVHEAIMGVLTIVLGPAGATTLAIVKSVFDGLAKVGSDNGWLTLFDRQTVKESVAHFQVATAQKKNGGIELGLITFSIVAKEKFTQVLFFKMKKNRATLRYAGGTAVMQEQVLGAIRDSMRTQLQSAAKDFVASIPVPPH